MKIKTQQNLWDTEKAVFIIKFMAIKPMLENKKCFKSIA